MKKLLLTIIVSLFFVGASLADDLPTGMTITLNPGWNVVSTPTVLSNVSFSNGGDGISFMYLEGNEWKNTVITSSNVASVFKPLEGFLVKNNNSEDVKMTLSYDMNIDIAGVMREKQVRAGRNFLGITKTSNPFEKIVSTTASIIVDFSRKFYNGASVSYMTENPSEYEIGKAYGVFADKSGVYGGLTAFLTNINCEEPNIAAVCAVDSVDCPAQCQTSYQEVTGIKLQNTNLGSVSVNRGATSVTISEGTILVEKSVTIPSFNVTANNTGIDSLVFIVNGNEYTATTADGLTFTFENVQIAKSGKIQFKADIHDSATLYTTISLPSITKEIIQNAKFLDNNQEVGTENIAGSISFSTIHITVPKASIENTITDTVSFPLYDDISEIVYSGTYTTKFGDIYLNNIRISSSSNLPNGIHIYFTLFINDNKVTEFTPNVEETFSNIQVSAGQSANIKIVAEVDAYGYDGYLPTFEMRIGGEDINGDIVGNVSCNLAPMKIVDGNSMVASPLSGGNTVLLVGANATVAKFSLKPAYTNEAYLDEVSFSLNLDNVSLNPNDIIFDINGTKYEAESDQNFIYGPGIPTNKNNGVVVSIILKNPTIGNITLNNLTINGHSIQRTFAKKFVNALVKVEKQENKGAYTKFTLSVEKYDDTVEVKNLDFLSRSGSVLATPKATVSDGDTVSADNTENSRSITNMVYYVDGEEVSLDKATYEDFFVDADGEDLRVFASK